VSQSVAASARGLQVDPLYDIAEWSTCHESVMWFTLERTRRNPPSPKCKQYPKKLISREGVEINGRGKKSWSQNDMLHPTTFESSDFEKGYTPKMQKNEWGFTSQILGANFSKSAHFKSFLLPIRIGRSESNRFRKFYRNLSTRFSDTGVRIFLAKIFGPP
jgi:hypothetical protein